MGDSVEVEKYTALSLGLRVLVVWEEQPSWVNQTDHVPNKEPSKHQKGIRTRNQGSKKQEWVLNRTKTEAKNTGSISIEQEIGNELGPGMQHPGQGIQAMSHSKPWKNENHRNQEKLVRNEMWTRRLVVDHSHRKHLVQRIGQQKKKKNWLSFEGYESAAETGDRNRSRTFKPLWLSCLPRRRFDKREILSSILNALPADRRDRRENAPPMTDFPVSSSLFPCISFRGQTRSTEGGMKAMICNSLRAGPQIFLFVCELHFFF